MTMNSTTLASRLTKKIARMYACAPWLQCKRAVIGRLDIIETGFAQPVKGVVLLVMLVLQEAGAQHRRQRHRDDAGKHDRQDDGDGEFVQQPADNAAHEDQGNEHRRQRQGHGQDGEADLGRALQRRVIGLLAHFDVPDDILQHHDGVIHHEAHRQGQRHQRQIVEL